jgi:hypothetical protein
MSHQFDAATSEMRSCALEKGKLQGFISSFPWEKALPMNLLP